MKINYSFIVLILFTLYTGYINNLIIFLICLFLHEISHIIFILIFKVKIKSFNIYAYGCIIDLDDKQFSCLKKYKKIIIYIVGIVVNLILFIIFKGNLFGKYNLILFAFNLLPIYPLDGFNLLKLIFNNNTIINITVFFLILLFIVGYYFNSLALIVIFLVLLIKNIVYIKKKDKIYLLQIINSMI